MSARVVSHIQTRATGQRFFICHTTWTQTYLYITYGYLPSYFAVILNIWFSLAKKIQVKVYANQDDFVSEIQPRSKSLLISIEISHELLMNFINIANCINYRCQIQNHKT